VEIARKPKLSLRTPPSNWPTADPVDHQAREESDRADDAVHWQLIA
jgi:hypothetical protein